jgi:hypothetical protein
MTHEFMDHSFSPIPVLLVHGQRLLGAHRRIVGYMVLGATRVTPHHTGRVQPKTVGAALQTGILVAATGVWGVIETEKSIQWLYQNTLYFTNKNALKQHKLNLNTVSMYSPLIVVSAACFISICFLFRNTIAPNDNIMMANIKPNSPMNQGWVRKSSKRS